MGWMTRLWETYEIVSRQGAFDEADHPLAEAGFVEKRGNILVTLNADATFREAERLERDQNDRVIMPTCPEAESRVGNPAPYPLLDQLLFVAGDGYSGKDAAFFEAYLTELTQWASQEDAPEALKILQRYIAKGSLIHDMRAAGFQIDPNKDRKQLICFRIVMKDGDSERLWERRDIKQSWSRRSVARRGDARLCFVEGRIMPILDSHPKLVGNGKLISSQDTGTIFQYKGRFTEPNEAVMVSYDASIKAHNTLLWLLKRQGFNRYGIQAVAWTAGGGALRLPIEDEGMEDDEEDIALVPQTFQEYGVKVRSMLMGHMENLGGYKQETLDRVNLLALEAATPGRVSVVYHQELPGNEYVQRLGRWYSTCCWEFKRFVGRGDARKLWHGVSSPTPYEIAMVVYGKRQADTARGDLRNEKSATKAVRELKLRLLHCMVDEAGLPRDIVLSAFHRVTAPMGFTNDKGEWQQYDWNLALSTFCALLHKWQMDHNERVIEMSLEQNIGNHERSFLFGRLLAVVDIAERRALGKDNYRETNAFRYMQLFQQKPLTTWGKLHSLIVPYFAKLREDSQGYVRKIAEITALFEPGDFERADALNECYLQGFYCQREAFYQGKGFKRDDDLNDSQPAQKHIKEGSEDGHTVS